MIIPINNLGQYGIIKDLPAHDLPSGAWSDGNNVRFRDGRVEKIKGHQAVYSTAMADTNMGILHMQPVFLTDGNAVWFLAGQDTIFKLASGALTDVGIATGYSGADSDRWNGCVFGGVSILNNGVDAPQMYIPGTSTLYSDLTWLDGTSTWDNTNGTTGGAGDGFRCKVMRSFRDHLVALDVTDLAGTDTRDPFQVRWSHAAVAGAVPTSWDPTDDAVDAGFYSLVETADYLVDCLTLRDVNIVYKEGTTWLMRYVGPPNVFEFTKLLGEAGMMAQQCAVEFNNQHIVKTLDDLIIHNGAQVTQRITDKSWRRWLSNTIDTDNYLNSFMVPNHRQYEVWFCFPETGSTFATKALIWNYQDNTLSVRDIPNVTHAALGIVDSDVVDTFAAATGTIAEAVGPYDIRFYDPISRYVMMSEYKAVGTDGVLYQIDLTEQFDGNNVTSNLQRLGMPIGTDSPEKQAQKMVRAVYPYIYGTTGGVVQIRIGIQATRTDDVTWNDWQDYTIGTTRKLDLRMTGLFISIDVRSNTNIEWSMDRIEIDARTVGTR